MLQRSFVAAAFVAALAAPSARGEVRPDVGLGAGPGSCIEFFPSLGIAAHGGVKMPAGKLLLGVSVVGDMARYWDQSDDDPNGPYVDVYHVAGRFRLGPLGNPIYMLAGFGTSYMTNRLDVEEIHEVPAIARWSPIVSIGVGGDYGHWGFEANVRHPLNRRLVDNTGFGLGTQLDVRIGVWL